ncbi:unnamed protein product [Prunus brigantina]
MVDYRGHLVKVIEMQLRELKLILVALPAASYLNMPLFILMQKYVRALVILYDIVNCHCCLVDWKVMYKLYPMVQKGKEVAKVDIRRAKWSLHPKAVIRYKGASRTNHAEPAQGLALDIAIEKNPYRTLKFHNGDLTTLPLLYFPATEN